MSYACKVKPAFIALFLVILIVRYVHSRADNLLQCHVPDPLESSAHCREVDDDERDHRLCQKESEIINDRVKSRQ